MTLSAIQAMFIPGDYWKVEYSSPEMLKKRPFRQVHQRRGNELVWAIGSLDKFYTPWPKAAGIISAKLGRLEFRYEGQSQSFTFTRLTRPEEIQEAAAHINACAIADAAAREKKKIEKQETKARLDAEARKSREDKIRNLEPVTPEELIEVLRDHDIAISPGTVGALRKKIQTITAKGWSYVARNKPRFTYECQPSVLYMKAHDALLLQLLSEPTDPITPDPDMDHLFGISALPEIATAPPMAFADAFADF